MTKIITSTCLVQLVERGVISLDEDIKPMLPELAKLQILNGFDEESNPIMQENNSSITLRYYMS